MRFFAIVTLAALTMVACGREVAGLPIQGTVNALDPQEPCSLLSPRQVQRAIKTKVDGEREGDSHDPVTRICHYEAIGPWGSVGLSLDVQTDRDEFTKRLRRDPQNTERVDGIGDGAFIHACSSISVLVGDVLVTVGVQHVTMCEETGVVLRALGREVVTALREPRLRAQERSR
jgi:hypothetical protein